MSKLPTKKQEPSIVPKDDVFDTRDVVKTLEGLMGKVTAKDCSPETVNAACNCAGRITDILKVHLDYQRLKSRFDRNKNFDN